MDNQIKVLVVDDSLIIRKALTTLLKSDNRFEVVGQAANGKEALELATSLQPDVITLDIEMPVMDGLMALKHLMISNPRPVVMLSSLTLQGAEASFDALRLGAVDFITKPSKYNSGDTGERITGLHEKIELAASVSVGNAQYIRTTEHTEHKAQSETCNEITVIGAAEGGYASLLKIIPALQIKENTAWLVVLYEETAHVDAFANYLDRYSAVNVMRPVNGEAIMGNTCYLCSGDEYTTLHARNFNWEFHVENAPFGSHKGATDMLMFSVSELCASNTTGIILSGQGKDGAEGLEEIQRLGGKTMILDPAACMHDEMARSGMKLNPNTPVLPVSNIISNLNNV